MNILDKINIPKSFDVEEKANIIGFNFEHFKKKIITLYLKYKKEVENNYRLK